MLPTMPMENMATHFWHVIALPFVDALFRPAFYSIANVGIHELSYGPLCYEYGRVWLGMVEYGQVR